MDDLDEGTADLLEYFLWFRKNPGWNVDILPSGEPIVFV